MSDFTGFKIDNRRFAVYNKLINLVCLMSKRLIF